MEYECPAGTRVQMREDCHTARVLAKRALDEYCAEKAGPICKALNASTVLVDEEGPAALTSPMDLVAREKTSGFDAFLNDAIVAWCSRSESRGGLPFCSRGNWSSPLEAALEICVAEAVWPSVHLGSKSDHGGDESAVSLLS